MKTNRLTALKEDRINRILLAVKQELFKGMQLHQAYNSVHEAYSVILEELDEFWDEVRKKRQDRSQALMSRELIQVAATSLRTIFDLTSQYQDCCHSEDIPTMWGTVEVFPF